MGIFGKREVRGEPTVGEMLARVEQCESHMRQLETEQLTLHDQVRKWMRRAIAAERTVERAAGKAPAGAAPTQQALPWSQLTGVRARRLANRAAAGYPGPPPADNGERVDALVEEFERERRTREQPEE